MNILLYLYRKTGKLFIYKKNAIILLVCVFLICFTTIFAAVKKYIKLQNCKNKLTYLQSIAVNSLDTRKKTKNFIEKFMAYDKFFIDNNLENLKFLQSEKNTLDKLSRHPAFCNNSHIKKRIDFINSGQNMLKFAEETVIQTALVKETDESQINTIEIDENDLQKILLIIELSQFESALSHLRAPQLIIKKFVLNKEKENVFHLNLKIIKREYFKKQHYE